MVAVRQIISLGSFITGEVPAPLEYQFFDSSGVPLNLTGFTIARFQWGSWIGGTPFQNTVVRNALITDPVNGLVTYAWLGDEFSTTGHYAGVIFVNNGTNQFASFLIEWQVCASPDVPPSV